MNKLLKSITNPIEYVKKAIDIELAIDTSMKDVGQITMLFEVLHQLDKSNVEFWIKHLEFELKERVENCSGLYWRASKCCDEQELAVKYSQLQQ